MKQTLGQRLKERRVALGWSQRQLEDISDVSCPLICQIETGKNKNPTWKTMCNLSYALDLSLDEFAKCVQ